MDSENFTTNIHLKKLGKFFADLIMEAHLNFEFTGRANIEWYGDGAPSASDYHCTYSLYISTLLY